MSPHEVVYGVPPLRLSTYVRGTTQVDVVDNELCSRKDIVHFLKENLPKARQRMKMGADTNRMEWHFEVGDWVFLKLQPYRQQTVNLHINL